MPLTNIVADALGVLTICLVGLLVLLGLFCIIYSFYFHTRIHNQGYIQLDYFSSPWIVRITLILFAIWWGFGEIARLNFLRREGRILNALNLKWQESVCKGYIVSNLGFAEPCMFLTLAFLLRSSLQRTDSGTLTQRWNGKTAVYVLLCCFPLLVLQLGVILLDPEFNPKEKSKVFFRKLPSYFTSAVSSKNSVVFCIYPLFSTAFLGLFAMVLTTYFIWIGRRIVKLVINKGLQKRVYTLIFSISCLLPLRILFLGLSVVSEPEKIWFEAFSFLAFLSLLCCAGVNIFLLVYYPIADSLALRRSLQDVEVSSSSYGNHHDTVSLIANQSYHPVEEIGNRGRNFNNSSGKCESIEEEEEVGGGFVELSLFCPSGHPSPPDSPQLHGWPMVHSN
ncbi:uncharacterized protein LOC124910563 [Impatiens glandulifera]|uniref:uncharacterized protein LOC124910563 n=1 Tax=Impatiens glandulifera TaxID=253017 RepID=UPI001FB0B882|nr:uncharacterized protein LOC124910563 [Impatiens glandulifera]